MIVYLHCATGPDADARLAAVYARQEYTDVADRGLSGSAAQVAAGARRWIDAGADTVVLQPTEDDPDPAGFAVFAADVGRELSSEAEGRRGVGEVGDDRVRARVAQHRRVGERRVADHGHARRPATPHADGLASTSTQSAGSTPSRAAA